MIIMCACVCVFVRACVCACVESTSYMTSYVSYIKQVNYKEQ